MYADNESGATSPTTAAHHVCNGRNKTTIWTHRVGIAARIVGAVVTVARGNAPSSRGDFVPAAFGSGHSTAAASREHANP